MSSFLSVLRRIKDVLERPKGVKSRLKFVQSRLRVGKANKLRKEVPGGSVLAQSELLPSEADSVGGLRQDDLAVIRSEELVLSISELSQKAAPDPHHEVEYAVLKAASEGRWEEINQVFNRPGQQERVLHAQNEFGWSPLHFAVYYGHLNIVNQLVNVCRLPPEQKTKDGRSPLMVAAGAGHLPVAKLLLETHRSNVNEEDSKSATPVMYAARRGHLPVVKVLLEHEADVFHKAEDSVTALHLAAYGGSLECVEYLMSLFGDRRFEMDENGRTCLHYAVWGGSLKVMRYLVDWCRFDLGLRTADGRTPLMLAASAGHLQVAEHLVETYKCKVPEEDSEGSATALHLAAYGGSVECVEYLLPLFGDRKFAVDENGWTCLHHAIGGGSVPVVNYLVDQCGFDLNKRTGDGLTPLMLAAQFGNLSVAKLLVETYHCDLNEKSKDKSSTPMMFAAQYGHRPIVELLVDHGADVFQKAQGSLVALHHAAYGGSIECVKYLLPHFGERKFEVDENGLTCLHWAVLGGSLPVVRYLVDQCGFDLRLRTASGQDCFLLACGLGHQEIVRELLTRDEVDQNVVDKDGCGALHLACQGGHTEFVQMLVVEFQFPTDIRDNNGRTPIQLASDFARAKIIKALNLEDSTAPQSHESVLEDVCWIPSGIESLFVTHNGGEFPLVPGEREGDKQVILLCVPPGAVKADCEGTIEVRYAVIAGGPFQIPEGYRLCSTAVYIKYSPAQTTKPFLLSLPHWSGAADHPAFVTSPHTLPEGEQYYPFRLLEGGEFGEGYGIVKVDGHCSLFALAYRQEDTSRYYASLWEREEGNSRHSRVAITFANSVWIQILNRYWKKWKKQHNFQFRFVGDLIEGNLDVERGRGWDASTVGPNKVSAKEVEFKRVYRRRALKEAVMEEVYPPSITLKAIHSKVPERLRCPRFIHLLISGTKPSQLTFPVEVFEEKCEMEVVGSPEAGVSDRCPLSQPVHCCKKYAVLFRKHVSRQGAGKGKAILECVGLTRAQIQLCYQSNPRNEEEAIQDGLHKWQETQGDHCTWQGLLEAMKSAGIAEQHCKELAEELCQWMQGDRKQCNVRE